MNCSVWLVCGASAKAAYGHGLDGGNVVRSFVSELDGHGLVLGYFVKI